MNFTRKINKLKYIYSHDKIGHIVYWESIEFYLKMSWGSHRSHLSIDIPIEHDRHHKLTLSRRL
jgi:hypothetical protein